MLGTLTPTIAFDKQRKQTFLNSVMIINAELDPINDNVHMTMELFERFDS